MSALALSVLLSVVSALAYAGGAIAQEQVAVSSPDSAYLPLRRPGWWGALSLNGLGGVLHVVALACGPLSLVQPLGALTIVFALPMAALCVGRRAGATAWRGALMATAGLAGLLSLVGSSSGHSLAPAQRVAVALVTGGAVVALMLAGLAVHRHPAVRSVLLATASGIAFGMSSVFTKTVAVDWSHGLGLGELPSLAVIGLFTIAGVLLSQASYRGGGLAAPLATATVVNPMLAAAVGILMFGETFRYGTTGTVLALGCGVVAAGGLIMLTTERLEHTTAPAAATPASAAATPASAAVSAEAAAVSAEAAPGVASATVPAQAAAEHAAPGGAVPAGAVPSGAVPAGAVLAGAVPAVGEASSAASAPAVLSSAVSSSAHDATATTAASARAATDTRLAVPRQRGAGPGEAEPAGLVGPGEAEPAGLVGPGEAEPAGFVGPGAGSYEPVPHGVLVPGPAGNGADADTDTDTDTGARSADRALPASYALLSASIFAPLPVLDRQRTRVRS
ncbi:DMT family transporter [Streptomyces sp. NPDC014636]|uniref:DMT family transporter n=1 Tax=Streptomyces sp. NPDC014636 TaxID=3364876 RepID=UPI0036F9633A